jgi:ATP-binding cassette, subfamily G (WHITE), member 2, SNQ2
MATPTDTITLNGDERSTPRGVIETGHDRVDIAHAEAAFNDLSHQLSKSSQAAREIVRTNTIDSITKAKDVEKADEVDETFDLRDYLTSSNDANAQAGIKHKHVGVTWEDLQVDVVGGVGSKVNKLFVFALDII